jgi:uncharacterized membrane protein YoaK (UPF0700 family)
VNQRLKNPREQRTIRPFYRRLDVVFSVLAILAAREAVKYFEWHPAVLWVTVSVALVIGARAAFQFIRQM